MTQSDLKAGFTLESVQGIARDALALYQADPVANRQALSLGLSFVQCLLVSPTITRTRGEHDPVKREYPITYSYSGGESHRAVSALLDKLHAEKVVMPDGTDVPRGPRKGSVAGKTVSTADPAAIVADTKTLFGLK